MGRDSAHEREVNSMGTGGGLVVIDFTKQGNAANFTREGWSVQEPDRIWGVGPRSVLRIPLQASLRTMMLEAEIGPLRAPPAITAQLLRVRVNGTMIGAMRLTERSMIRCEIDPALARHDGTQEIQFEFPGFCKLDWFQTIPDGRPLSGWFSFIRLYTTDMFKPGPWFPATHPDFPVINLPPPSPEPASAATSRPIVYTFGLGGTAEQYLGDDWIAGEAGFRWTVATTARLRLPAPTEPGAYALRVDAKAALEAGIDAKAALEAGVDAKAALKAGGDAKAALEAGGGAKAALGAGGGAQKVTIVLDGVAISQLEFDEFGSWVLPLPAELLAGKSLLEFDLIVAGLRPTEIGDGETRLAGVGVSRVAIIPLPSRALLLERGDAKPPRPATVASDMTPAPDNVTLSDRFGDATPDALAAAVETALGVDLAVLARGFESLGADQGFAHAQRALGCDMLHLFSGCECGLTALVQAMTDDLAALIDPAEIKVTTVDGSEARQSISVAKYNLCWRLPDARGKAMTAREVAVMFGYLRRKFFEGLRAGHKIHVLSLERGICLPRAAALLLELRRHGPATLLCVEPATEARRAGTVERVSPGLLRGYVDSAAGGEDGATCLPVPTSLPALTSSQVLTSLQVLTWLQVLGNAALLHRRFGEMMGAR